jgi:hypothetical protein
MSPDKLVRRSRLDAYATIAVTIFVTGVAMVLIEGTEADAAAAGVAAVVIGIAGTSLGHNVGFHRQRSHDQAAVAPDPDAAEMKDLSPGTHAAVLTGLIVVVLLLPALVLVWDPSWESVSADGIVALGAALLGIVATDIAHAKFLSRSEQHWLGHLFIGIGFVGTLLLINASPDKADGVAAIGGTVVAVGGTVIGFNRGRRAART